MVLTEMIAVSPEGRITPGTPGLYRDEHVDVWRSLVDRIHEETAAQVMFRLGHAGPRGATRPRREGVDRPLRAGAWQLLAASPVPYTTRSQPPREAGADDLAGLVRDFGEAARRCAEAGADALLLDLSHGYLLASFVSPLTNRREDGYGRSFEARVRFPLQVFDQIRSEWPKDRLLGAALTVNDWTRGGSGPDDALRLARLLKDRGCDLIRVVAGQTTWHARPEYGPMFLVPSSDRVRNEGGVPTMVGGAITTYDHVDTVLAAGRADLCILDVPAM